MSLAKLWLIIFLEVYMQTNQQHWSPSKKQKSIRKAADLIIAMNCKWHLVSVFDSQALYSGYGGFGVLF